MYVRMSPMGGGQASSCNARRLDSRAVASERIHVGLGSDDGALANDEGSAWRAKVQEVGVSCGGLRSLLLSAFCCSLRVSKAVIYCSTRLLCILLDRLHVRVKTYTTVASRIHWLDHRSSESDEAHILDRQAGLKRGNRIRASTHLAIP